MPETTEPEPTETAIRRPAGGTKKTPGSGIHLVDIAGFEISLDYSWFILLFLILGTLAGAVFPQEAPGLSDATYLVMGTVGTVLFFASLIGHELSHSVAARMKGVEVEGITLFIFGGMARTRSEATSPGDEFIIAGVGPLASLVFAAAFYGLEAAGHALGLGPAFTEVAWYLGLVNLALAIFNLLPGFPLDGGRLLRAILWGYLDDLRKATRVATGAGKWLGYGIIGLGLFGVFMAGNLIGGLWFVFIGWFLSNAAQSSYRQLLLRQVLGDVRADDAMSRNPESVEPDLTLHQVVHERFLHRPYNAFPVVEDGVPIGLVTLSQVKGVDRDDWSVKKVADVMTPLEDTLIVSPETSMTEVLQRMNENETRRVLVAREWQLLGIISASDVANWLDRAGILEG
ncbi:MAG: site-2 protease family protein [Gemmatimonadota bacterium]